MIIGIATPIVLHHPALSSTWEKSADVTSLISVAQAADSFGYDHLTCSEHVAVPISIAAERGGTYWDPTATLGFLAARTEQIRLATSVVVVGYHHPLAIAKRYSTLDRLSGGRVVLGVGVGSLREEFELLGASFDDRGKRADDAVHALRAALGECRPVHDGDYYRFDGLVAEPTAVQQHLPIWLGGRSRPSLRRAVSSAEGWMPFALTPVQLSDLLSEFDLPAGFTVVGQVAGVDAIDEPEQTLERLKSFRAAGATMLSVSIRAQSASHYIEQLEALAVLAEVGKP